MLGGSHTLYEAECGPETIEYVVIRWHGEVIAHFAVSSGLAVERSDMLGKYIEPADRSGVWSMVFDDLPIIRQAYDARLIDDDTFAKLTNTPIIGIGATYYIGSDSYAYTITRISKSGKSFWMRMDGYRAKNGSNRLSETQEYEYTPDPHGPIRQVRWSARYERWKCGPAIVALGHRRTYFDPSF